MAIVSKTNRDGVDIVIEQLQQKFYPSLLGYWDGAATYQMYPRANKNYRNDDIIPEVSLDQKDYTEVLNSDKFSVTSFFLNNDERIFSDADKRIKQSISIIFQADLVALYGQTERMDEQFNMDVLRVLKKENFYIYGDITFTEGIDNVYRDLIISGELKESVKLTDLSNFHVLKASFDIIYKPNCNATLPPVCAGVSISVDGVFSEVKPAGSTYNCITGGTTTLDVSVNGTLFYTDVSTNQDLPVKDSTGANNVGSKVGSEWRVGDTQVILKNSANETLSTQNFYAESQANEMVADNVTSDFNGVTLLQETPSGQNKSIIVQTVDANPIGDVIEDTPNILRIEIQNSQALNTSNPFKTGQTTSYVANDDGDLERGNGVDFLTLSHNNYFGNTNRFTDILGGQTYADNWIIDWSTYNQVTGAFLMWYRVYEAAATWTNAMAAQPYTRGAYADCYLPNEAELYNLLNRGVTPSTNYAPFNLNVVAANNGLWTSTTIPNNTLAAYFFAGTAANNTIGGSSKVANQRFILMRYGNISEL